MVKQKTVYNFFKFLEDKRGEKMPFRVKLIGNYHKFTEGELHIEGSLHLDTISQGSNTTKLPDNLKIEGNLNISNSKIKRLPDGLKVGGSIVGIESELEYIPDNFTVFGVLFLTGSKKLKMLPKNLEVHKSLYISDTGIKRLPDDIKIGGSILAANSKLEYIPDNFSVITINAISSELKFIPDNLTLLNDLVLNRTNVKSIPNNLKIGGNFHCGETPLQQKYTREQIKKMIEDKGGYVKGDIFFYT